MEDITLLYMQTSLNQAISSWNLPEKPVSFRYRENNFDFAISFHMIGVNENSACIPTFPNIYLLNMTT